MAAHDARAERLQRILRPSGDLDLVTVDALRASLTEAVDDSSVDLLIDLELVGHVDIVALSSILAAADTMREQGRTLHVAAAKSDLRRVCALLRAEDVLVD